MTARGSRRRRASGSEATADTCNSRKHDGVGWNTAVSTVRSQENRCKLSTALLYICVCLSVCRCAFLPSFSVYLSLSPCILFSPRAHQPGGTPLDALPAHPLGIATGHHLGDEIRVRAPEKKKKKTRGKTRGNQQQQQRHVTDYLNYYERSCSYRLKLNTSCKRSLFRYSIVTKNQQRFRYRYRHPPKRKRRRQGKA